MGIKVNRISVNVDKYDTRISLYKTNQLVGFFYGDDIDIDPISKYDISLKAYQMYIRDLVINLLDNGGIEGYYYEPKQDSIGVKYDMASFTKKMQEYVQDIIGERYEFILMRDYNMEVEKYKDGYIKDAVARMKLVLKNEDLEMILVCMIKSGQACRPRTIEYGNKEYSFNITAVNKLVKQSGNSC